MVTSNIFKNHLLEVGLTQHRETAFGHFLLGSHNFMVTALGSWLMCEVALTCHTLTLHFTKYVILKVHLFIPLKYFNLINTYCIPTLNTIFSVTFYLDLHNAIYLSIYN